jgi:putative oxidoreductase
MNNRQPLSAFASAWAPATLSLLRIMTALLFVTHGLVKVFGFSAGAQPGQVPVASLLGVAGVMELIGGFAILVGLFTRPVAFLLAGEMAFAYFNAHAP